MTGVSKSPLADVYLPQLTDEVDELVGRIKTLKVSSAFQQLRQWYDIARAFSPDDGQPLAVRKPITGFLQPKSLEGWTQLSFLVTISALEDEVLSLRAQVSNINSTVTELRSELTDSKELSGERRRKLSRKSESLGKMEADLTKCQNELYAANCKLKESHDKCLVIIQAANASTASKDALIAHLELTVKALAFILVFIYLWNSWRE